MDLFIDDHFVSSMDILRGKNAPRSVRCHPGNKIFEFLVWEHHQAYQNTQHKAMKTKISRGLVDLIHSSGSRFLLWNDQHKMWQYLTLKQCREKTAVALKNKGKKRSKQIPQTSQRAAVPRSTPTGTAHLSYFDEMYQVQQDFLHGVHAPSNITSDGVYFDVYCVKGSQTALSRSPGNKLYVALIKINGSNYQNAQLSMKNLIIFSILFAITNRGGRFLVRDSNGGWKPQSTEASFNKIAQALRDTQKRLLDSILLEVTNLIATSEEHVDHENPEGNVISEIPIDTSDLNAIDDGLLESLPHIFNDGKEDCEDNKDNLITLI